MIRAGLAALLLLLTAPAGAETAAQAAAAASLDLQTAVAALEAAQGARDRVAALTRTLAAYESGLMVLRGAMRDARLRETQLDMQFQSKRDRIGQLLAVLSQMEAQPGPHLLLHPDGPLGTVRSAMLLAEVTPGLQAEAETLRRELAELRDLRAAQAQAQAVLTDGLTRVQAARTALSQAVSDRTDLPRNLTDDPEAMLALLAAAETLDAFAAGLTPLAGQANPDFGDLRGRLLPPVRGTLLRRAGEADAAGVRRPGVTLATRPRALVTAPMAATIRYRGPLLDYGNVMVLEPGGGYLVVLAGLGTVYGDQGQVVAQGDPLGLMGGAEPGTDAVDTAAVRDSESLYIELRRGTEPEDPAPWFAALGE